MRPKEPRSLENPKEGLKGVPSGIVGLWARTHTPAAGAVPRDYMGVGLSVIRSCALWGLENTATEQCHKHRNPSSGLRTTQHQQGQPPGFPALLTREGKDYKVPEKPSLGHFASSPWLPTAPGD